MNSPAKIHAYIAAWTANAERLERDAAGARRAGFDATADWKLAHAASYRSSIARLEKKLATLEG